MKIPVNTSKMVTETAPIDDQIEYRAIVRDCVENEDRDKNDNRFLKLKFEITEPDEWKGKTVLDNYMPIAEEPESGAGRGAWRTFEETNERFMRFLQGFRISVQNDEFDPKDAIGCEGNFTAKSEKFGGRTMSRVDNYLI